MAYQSASPSQSCNQHIFNSHDLNLVDQLSIILKFDEKELGLCGFIDKIPLETLKFFWDVILRKGYTINFTIDQLYSQVQKADPKIQQNIRNPKDIKDFLSNYPTLFTFDGEKVNLHNSAHLIEGHIKWIKALLQNDYPDINRTVLNAIQFYSDILFDKEDNFPISMLVTHRNKARQDVQIIAINPVELKSFLIAYPQVFIVIEDKVSLTYSAACDRSDYSWLGEVCGMEVTNPRLRLLGKAVIYYLLVLFKKEVVHQLALSKLFDFRNLAPKDIKDLTKTVADLKKLFVKYLCVFQINKNNVTIKDFLLINLKRDEIRLRGKKGCDLSTKEIIFMIQENLIKTALDVCLRTIKNTLDLKCSLEVPLKELLSEFDYLFENVKDLKKFLSNHPNDFTVKDDKVSLRSGNISNDISDTSLKSKLPGLNQNVKPMYQPVLIEQLKDFCVNFLLQNVGVNVQFPLTQLKNCISLAPPELQPILSNEKKFKSVISQYSNVLNVTDNYILLKKSHEDPSVNFPKNKVNESLMFFVWVLKEKVGMGSEFPIARLKIYVDLAPSEVKIEDILQLKTLFRKYPDIFSVNNNNVILKEVDEKYCKYARYEKLCYVETYSTAEAIAFYARILNRFCSNLEVPIEHLFGYRSLAPVEVLALTKSNGELKKFLSTHPDIFTVQENNVCLTKTFDHSESNLVVYDGQEALAIKFYSSIFERVSQNNEFPIVRLFGFQYLAPPEVRELIKTPLELKDFFNKYPNLFFVNNDVVILKKLICKNNDLDIEDKLRQSGSFIKEVETTLSDLNLHSQPTKKTRSPTDIHNKTSSASNVNKGFISRKSSVIRAIRFYSNIMFKKGPNSEHLISNLLCFRTEATQEIKEIAKKPNELLNFLSKCPQIFTVDNSKQTVMLTDMVSFYKNERNWIKELLPKYHQSTTNHEIVVSGIQFYVNIIFGRGLEILPIKSLFRYRKTAMGDVQTLANNASELKDFLSMYPEIFKIIDDGVSLTEIAVSHKIEPKWIAEIIDDNHLLDKSSKSGANENNELSKGNSSSSCLKTLQKNDPTPKDVNTLMALNFFKSLLEAEGKSKNMTHSKLFEYLYAAPQDVKELFKTHSELKDFFNKYSDVFTVKDNFVSLVISKDESKVNKKKRKKRSVKNLDSSNSPAIVIDNISTYNNSENDSLINKVTHSDNKLTQASEKNNSQFNLVSTILFYSNIIWRKGPHLEHTIGSIFCHSSKASSNVRETVKNTKELKEFFLKYPQLFSVNLLKQTVTFSNLQQFHKNQRSWIKEMLPEHHQSTANHEVIVSTIQFYSNILFEKNPKCELQLSILFSHRNAAMEDVQMMVKNIKELNAFLSVFPGIFLINKDKVSLTDLVISQLKQPKWIEKLVSCNESVTGAQENTDTINEELLKKKKIATRRTVQFFYKIMLSRVSNNRFSLSQLFDYLHEAPSDVQEIVKTITELRDFFSKYPHIFTIVDSVVFLTTFNDR